MLEDPLKFSMFNFSKISKQNPKNDFTGIYQSLKGTKSWILVTLAQTLWKWQTISDRPGHNGPPPSWNRVNIWPFKDHKKVSILPFVSNFKQFSPFNLWKAQDHVCGTVKVTFLQFLYLFSSKMVIFESLQNNIWHSKGHSMVKFWLLATKTKRKKDIQRLKWSKTEVEALWLRKMTYESLLTSDL